MVHFSRNHRHNFMSFLRQAQDKPEVYGSIPSPQLVKSLGFFAPKIPLRMTYSGRNLFVKDVLAFSNHRRKVAEIMEGYGYRVQYSVFECDLNKKKLVELQRRLKPLVKTREMDSVRFYPLPADAVAQIQVLGNDMARSLGIVTVV